ncbi:MAG: DUF5686 family protein [Bacteroidota bacterium]
MKYILFFLPFIAVHLLTGQHHVFSGIVQDAETKQLLPSATVRVLGTSKGTITNTSGQFRLPLPSGEYRIAISYIGYQTDTIVTELMADAFRTVRLVPNAIQLSGVTVTDEDPAYEIIRRAIESKKRWMEQLKTFEGKAFSRMQIRTDSSIAAIMESYSVLYWNRDDSLREVIIQQKKTGNLQKSFSAIRVGNVVNFNDNRIALNGFVFVGPTAPEAFEYYDYKLLSTRKMDDFDVYEIELIPRSTVIPLLKGKISIAERSYAVMNVEVRPNEAYSQPFIDTKESKYLQSFTLFENRFWLPANYRFEGKFKLVVMGISFPILSVDLDVVIFDYRINPVFADTIRAMKAFTVDSSSTKYDSTFWQTNDVLPLTEEQDSAYATLDSTQTLEKKFAPSGTVVTVAGLAGSPFLLFDAWFTRVEGYHLGISRSFDNIVDDLDVRGGAGYGFSDRRWKYHAGVTLRFGEKQSSFTSSGFANFNMNRKTFSFSIDAYDKLVYIPEPLLPGLFFNTFTALLLKDDSQDYYRTIGSTIALTYAFNGTTNFTIKTLSEQQLSVYQTTNFSWLQKTKAYAAQPSIINGRMNAVQFSFSHANTALLSLAKEGYMLSGTVEHSARVLGGAFDFSTVTGKAKMKVATYLKEEMPFPPSMSIQLSGGTSLGKIPPQRYFELYSKFELMAGFGVLRALQRRQFYGDSYLALTVDHNFRRMLFSPLGIRSLMESNLELIVEANIARSWLSSRALRTPLFPSTDSNGWYTEASIGISNIADLFRIDVTRRFSPPGSWAVTLTVSEFITGFFAR